VRGADHRLCPPASHIWASCRRTGIFRAKQGLDKIRSPPARCDWVAIRQLNHLYPNASPTGWRHIGQNRIQKTFRRAANALCALAGDELCFFPPFSAQRI